MESIYDLNAPYKAEYKLTYAEFIKNVDFHKDEENSCDDEEFECKKNSYEKLIS